MNQYTKAILTGIALILNTLVAGYGDDILSMDEKQQIVTTLVSIAVGIYAVYKGKNAPMPSKDTPPEESA